MAQQTENLRERLLATLPKPEKSFWRDFSGAPQNLRQPGCHSKGAQAGAASDSRTPGSPAEGSVASAARTRPQSATCPFSLSAKKSQ